MSYNSTGEFVGHTPEDDAFEAAHPFKRGQRVKNSSGATGVVEMASLLLVKWDGVDTPFAVNAEDVEAV